MPLISKGASAVIGWDDLVGSSQNDQVMLGLLEDVLINDIDIKNAVESAEKNYSKFTEYNPNLLYYNGTA